MKWTIERFDAPRMFRVKLRGAFDTEKTREVMNEVSAEAAGCPRCPILFDYSDLDVRKVGVADLATAINSFVRHNPRFDYSKIAIYSGSRTNTDLAYRFKAVTESLSNALVEVFQRESEAVRWLTSPTNDDAEIETT